MVFVLLVVLAFSGCMDSNNNDDTAALTTPTVNPEGLWLGYQEVNDQAGSNVFDMKTIIYDGRFVGISEDANIMFAGSYLMTADKYLIANGSEGSETSYKMYRIDDNGQPFARGVTSMIISEQDSLQGVFDNEALQEGTITAYFSPLYSKGASLSYLTLTGSVDATGTLSGSKDSCTLAGAITVPQSSVNIYDVNYSLSGLECTKSGTYQGLGIVALDEYDKAYFLSLSTNSDESRMDHIFYYLPEIPARFMPIIPLAVNSATDVAIARSSDTTIVSDISNFAGAWWTDGTRCGVISLNECSARTYDSGLSYDQMTNRFTDNQSQIFNVDLTTQQSAQGGNTFVVQMDTPCW
jgi:hypothetical protein